MAHGPSPWPLFSSPVEAPDPGAEVPVVWAQEGAPAQLPCSPTIPLQDLSLLRTRQVTWQHLPDRYAPQTAATRPPDPAVKASRLPVPGPRQPSVFSPELSVPQKPVAQPPLPRSPHPCPSSAACPPHTCIPQHACLSPVVDGAGQPERGTGRLAVQTSSLWVGFLILKVWLDGLFPGVSSPRISQCHLSPAQ